MSSCRLIRYPQCSQTSSPGLRRDPVPGPLATPWPRSRSSGWDNCPGAGISLLVRGNFSRAFLAPSLCCHSSKNCGAKRSNFVFPHSSRYGNLNQTSSFLGMRIIRASASGRGRVQVESVLIDRNVDLPLSAREALMGGHIWIVVPTLAFVPRAATEGNLFSA